MHNQSDLESVRILARGALASLEASRRRLDDLNVYPVPDGDTGTNMTLTARGVVEALEQTATTERPALAAEVARAALMAARGNSGVILSQIVRGAADVLATARAVDADVLAASLRGASDAAYHAVRQPVEGTILTVVRELAEAAEQCAGNGQDVHELLPLLVERGEESVVRTTDLLPVLRDAGVVDAGGAGLVEIVRGLAAALRGEPLPEPPAEEELAPAAIHLELSRFRYCTTFVVTGERLDADAIERELARRGDSLLVVGDSEALKIHLHTDDPDDAIGVGAAVGTIAQVEVADMHEQTAEREARLSASLAPKTTAVVAVVAGEGNLRLFASLGASRLIEGGQTMNPSTRALVDAIEAAEAPEVVLLPNNGNVVMTADQAARAASKPVCVVPTTTIQAGLAALVAYHAERPADENAREMEAVLDDLATGAVTIASRDAAVDGLQVRRGEFLGLVGDDAVASGASFDEVASSVLELLLAEPREVLTLLAGVDAPNLNALQNVIAERHPELEIDVHDGGQPHYPLLVSAE